eukprot:UN05639
MIIFLTQRYKLGKRLRYFENACKLHRIFAVGFAMVSKYSNRIFELRFFLIF